MGSEKKLEILRSVEGSGIPVADALTKLGISPTTYYRWRRRFRTGGRESLHDRKPHRERNWNQLLPEERAKVLHVALLYPEWSSREIRCHIVDHCGFTVAESTVYRLLKQAGWIKPLDRGGSRRRRSIASRRNGPIRCGRRTRRTCW